MKKQLLIGVLLLGTFAEGRASLFFQGDLGAISTSGGTSVGSISSPTIVDGNPTIVTGNSMDLSSAGLSSLSSLTVSLNISGGNNGGLVAWLVYGLSGSTTTVNLMNQPGVASDPYGVGATGAGMNITLQDASSDHGNIQNETSGSVLTGSYNAQASLSGFNGLDPNGTWTLYFSDTISGGGDATLNGWSLDITPVPEPINIALGVFGVVMVGMGGVRRYLKQTKAT